MNLSLKLAILFCLTIFSGIINQALSQSNLANGDIYKLSIKESGIYRINSTFINENFDITVGAIDPKKIQIFCGGGGVLPRLNQESIVNDPLEIPIYVSGDQDGSFDGNDFIYFYAPGPEIYDLNNSTPEIKKNVFSEKNFVYIKFNTEIGKRISNLNSVSGEGFASQTSHKIHRHEIELTNLLGANTSTQGTGQQWFGEAFSNDWIQDFSEFFTSVNPVPGSTALVQSLFVGRSNSSTKVKYTIANEQINLNISPSNLGSVEATYAKEAKFSENVIINSSPSIQIEYLPAETTDKAWLDYLQITTEEAIQFKNNELILRLDSRTEDVAGFSLEGLGSKQLWHVSDFKNIQNCLPDGNNFFYNTDSNVKMFRIFDPSSDFQQVEFESKIENQNIKDIKNLEFLIVYHSDFEEAATKLLEHRSTVDPLNVEMVDVQSIYNEFSSGRAEPTAIRDFARVLQNSNQGFKYMLLLGDASYDYRGLVADLPKTNFVPTYETEESLSPIDAFPYDDFFALLSPTEGENFVGGLDLNIGRLPAKTSDEAMDMVNKIIHYDTDVSQYNEWKMRASFAADDEDNNRHIDDADHIAEMVYDSFPLMNQTKIYFDAFLQESTPGGERYPAAKAKIHETINKGVLVFNYLGHGGPSGLAQERVLLKDDVRTWNNIDKLPIIITATCSFTGYDDPAIVSAGEEAILNPNGGAVALFTTTRAVYAQDNARLTESVFENIFDKVDGDYQRIGEIMRKGKNTGVDSLRENARKFSLIGDPTMRLNAPQHNVVLDRINEKLIDSNSQDTLRALERVNLKGHIADDSGQVLNFFNGKVFVTLFDKRVDVKTLKNNSNSYEKVFKVQNNILFKGSASVVNGNFSIDFLLPKEINFNYGYGKISMYATDGETIDAGGFYKNVIIGGSNESNITDSEGPEMDIYMNDQSFVPGGITSLSPTLLVNLKDEFGINISSTSIGHDITAVIDDDESKIIKLNDWYEAETDNFNSGVVRYPLGQIAPGLHKIRIKAWDLCNNSSEKELEFRVVDKDYTTLEHVLNYPNPFTTSTNFSFEHQFAGGMLDIGISIFTLSGKLVKTISTTQMADGYRTHDIFWDGNDDFGSKLAKGVYLYKIKVRDQASEMEMESDFTKLLILK